MNLVALGSQTARNGFRNEDDIIVKFNSWRTDVDSPKWLTIIGYKLDEIQSVLAVKIQRCKTDVQVQVIIYITGKQYNDVQNLQVKLVSNLKGFNQVDKRWVDNYSELWSAIILLICNVWMAFGLAKTMYIMGVGNIPMKDDMKVVAQDENVIKAYLGG
jgi:hypothetical protein